jgi:carboxypeptidase Q
MLWLFIILPIISVTSRSFIVDNQSSSLHAISDRLIELVTQGTFRGVTYNRLAALADTIGPRLCGNESLTAAINWVQNGMINEALDNVHIEEVQIPHWVRGNERAQLLQPRNTKLSMLGLGNSIGTGPKGIQAPVLVVRSFDELDVRCEEARNKIVVFNPQCDWQTQPVACYGPVVAYRVGGASRAAKCGALASLSRSAASRSIDSPHTGVMAYDSAYPKIPAGSLSVEHTDMLDRFQQRNQSIEIYLYMEAQTLPNVVGYNLVAEVRGSHLPNETVLVSGHLDSWDVGQGRLITVFIVIFYAFFKGAMDDGGGAMISWTVLSLIRSLNIRAKRTIRCVLWSCEEFGGVGADQYFTAHEDEVPKMSIVMESDLGVFHPQGLQFQGKSEAQQVR